MGTFLKVPGRVPGLLDELHHQDFPSFPGNTVDDVTTFCRKLPVSERLRCLSQNTQPTRREKEHSGHLSRVHPLSQVQVLTHLRPFAHHIDHPRRGSVRALESC